jgi:mannose-6-phosphate isomerase-like protein (cupin superfamily)
LHHQSVLAMPSVPTEQLGPGWEGATVRWPVSRAATGSETGSVAVIDVGGAGRYPVHQTPGCERIFYLLSGRGLHLGTGGPRPVEPGEALYIAPGQWHGFENLSSEPCRLIAVHAPEADPQRLIVNYGAPDRLDGTIRSVRAVDVADDPTLTPELWFPGLKVKWLITDETAGAHGCLLGTSWFHAHGEHELHRHPKAAEVIFFVNGDGALQLAGGEGAEPLPQQSHIVPGDVTYSPANEWHGHTAENQPMDFVFIYLGAASLAQAGYEQT